MVCMGEAGTRVGSKHGLADPGIDTHPSSATHSGRKVKRIFATHPS